MSREENPDTAVDLDVELITDGQVSGFKFAIQIKSVQKIRRVSRGDKPYIAYSFSTSRLGYLYRRKPGSAIITVYDHQNKVLYYDYVEQILWRVADEHGGDDSWKKKGTVTIYIAEENILTPSSITEIYETMKRRRLSFLALYSQGAYDFDLPTFDADRLQNPLFVIEKLGYVFFNKKEYRTLLDNISRLSSGTILDNHKILLLTALTYYETGYYTDARYYAEKCNSILDRYSEEERELLRLIRLFSDFFFGIIDTDGFVSGLKEAKNTMKGKMNLLMVRLKSLFFEILLHKPTGEKWLDYATKEIDSIFRDLSTLEMEPESRPYYLLEIISCIHEIGIHRFIESTMQLAIRRKVFGSLSMDERVQSAKEVLAFLMTAWTVLEEISAHATEMKNNHLKAMVLFKKIYMFYSISAQSVFPHLSDRNDFEQFKQTTQQPELWRQAYGDLITAYNLFLANMNLNSAYRALSLSQELNYLYSVIFQGDIDHDKSQEIEQAMRQMEQKLRLGKYEMFTESNVKQMIEKEQDDLSNLSIAEIFRAASIFADSIGLPRDRISNIVADISFLQRAKQEVNQNYFDVLQNLVHTKLKETMYKEKAKYVIQCRRCGYETSESDDLEVLIAEQKREHPFICF